MRRGTRRMGAAAVLMLALGGVLHAGSVSLGAAAVDSEPAAAPSLFARSVQPLLEERCAPCHFEGGKVYEPYPFDRPGTVRRLGERMFTRLKEEPDRAVVRAFLASPVGAEEEAAAQP